MACFEVYPHPDAALRRNTPFLLDVQNNPISGIATRVVVPDTAALAAVPHAGLKKAVDNLAAHSGAIVAALDVLFGAY